MNTTRENDSLAEMPSVPWTEAELLRYIDGKIRESSTLEYKRSQALAKGDHEKTQLSKDVSAFANSGGGIIIYGIVEDKNEPTGLDDGIDSQTLSKEWLDDVLSTSIRRRIDGVKIHVVDLRPPRQGRVAYVIEVPQSMSGPHMASDHKYYKRHNFKSEPMEDYEVRDVALRGVAPRLSVHLVFASKGPTFSMTDRRVLLDIIINNEGREPANAARIELAVDSRLMIDRGTSEVHFQRVEGQDPRWLPTEGHVYYWGGPNSFPVFSGSPAMVRTIQVDAVDRALRGPFIVWWSIATPHAHERQGVSVIHWESDSSLEVKNLETEEIQALPGVDWSPTYDDAMGRWLRLHQMKLELAAQRC